MILIDNFYWPLCAEDAEGNFSKVIHSVKWNYTVNYEKLTDIKNPIPFGKNWFLDYIVLNEGDLAAHFGYIHLESD